MELLPSADQLAGQIQAIVFDCYGTLIDIVDQHWLDLFAEICIANDLRCSGKELWDRWLAEGRRLGEERGRDPENPLSRPEPPFLPFRELWALNFEHAFRSLGATGDAAGGYARMHEKLSSAKAYPEVPEVLAMLRKHYELAVLSNADEDHLRICLARNGLEFETIISSERAQSYKPFPGIFRRASNLLDLEPAQMLYVGESPLPDVLGARAAGLPVAWLNRVRIPRPERMPEPDLEIEDLRGLLPLIGNRR
ncbi:MAG: HAD family hydrolase [Dehalococcoidia bacterium]